MPQLQFNPDWAAITATNVAKVTRAMAERGELWYFLMPRPGAPITPLERSSQEHILGYVSRTWENVSLAAGLPAGSLYRYPERQTGR